MEFDIHLHPKRNINLKRTIMKRFFSYNRKQELINKLPLINSKKLRNLFLMFILLYTSTTVFANPNSFVEGYVNDQSGTMMAGVNVMVKGTSNGVITNINGYYKINIGSKDEFLVFSFIGMKSQTVKISGRNRIDVVLLESQVELQEVVVVDCEREEMVVGACIKGRQEPQRKSQLVNGIGYMTGPVTYSVADVDYNTEGYATIHENGYKEVVKEPLSTFSVDVDRASYSNVRRFLNNGQMPPVDAVRVEEMLNYFSYDYKAPTDEHPFAVHHEMAVSPWNNQHYLMKIGLKGREIAKDKLPPSNLVFLLDVSGSMNAANKLPLLKSAFNLLVSQLRPNDMVSIVVYAGASGCVLEPTPGNQKQKIMDALNNLEAGGSTAGGAGLNLAYQKAEAGFMKGGNNRIILATDGDFNVGVSSNAEMERLVVDKRNKGIFITVLGFGMGNYKDDRLEIIANKGNGNYAYIDNLQEAQKTLVSEFGGTLFTIAKDVKFQIEFNPSKVLAYRLVGYENRLLNAEDFNDDKKDAGEIGAGHTVTALYEIIPVGASDAGKWVKQIDPLKYQKSNLNSTDNITDEWVTLKLRYKQPEGDNSQLMVFPVKGKVKSFENASTDFKFAASVAGFGMLLRNSDYKGTITYSEAQSMARDNRGADEDGFKAEMARLIQTAEMLSKQLAAQE
jgi:Ca-activated chloride channel family protein